jgi:hypothetical protein
LIAQNNSTDKGEAVSNTIPLTKFYIKPKYPPNVSFVYKRSSHTFVTQTLSDSTIVKYERILDTYFSIYSPSNPIDGLTKLKVSIDSLDYTYIRGKDTTKYNSQDDDGIPPYQLSDFEYSSITLGKEFFFYYSPYWDFGKIEGDRLTETRNYINDPLDGIQDTMRLFMWNQKLSDTYLANFVDILKNYIPMMPLDTSQVRRIAFSIEIDNKIFNDSADVQLKQSYDNAYIMEGKIDNLTSHNKKVRIMGFDILVDVQKAVGKGHYTLTISPQGRVDGGEGNFEINMILKDRNEIINQKIEEKIKYFLISNHKV